MKVLHIMATCSKSSGVARVIMNYYNQLKTIDKDLVFDFLVYQRTDNDYGNDIIEKGGEVICSKKPNIIGLINYLKFIKIFFKSNKGKYDAVHLSELYLSFPILYYAKKSGIKLLISHSHASKKSESILGTIRNTFLFFPCRHFSNVFIACTNEAGICAFGKKITNSKHFLVLPNCFDIYKYNFNQCSREKTRLEFGFGDDDIVIGHIGRFVKPKNHKFLIQVFNKLDFNGKQKKLVLIGIGPLQEKIKKLVAKYNLANNVLFVGLVDDPSCLLSTFDLFVFPSKYEGFGNAALEAQSNGIPCLLSETLPKMLDATNNVVRLPLKKGPDFWAKTAEAINLSRNTKALKEILDSGFDLKRNAIILYNLYANGLLIEEKEL